jgi:DNA-binding winged helix-turn-helix (wHTH) protein
MIAAVLISKLLQFAGAQAPRSLGAPAHAAIEMFGTSAVLSFPKFWYFSGIFLVGGEEGLKPMTEQQNPAYRFADFELQPRERRLLQAGETIPLTPKVFEILQLLVSRAGHAVSKDDMMAAIWPGRFIAESNLTKHIWTLRQSLGEGEQGGRFFETVPKLGYRYTAAVSRGASSPLFTAV